MKDNTAVRIAAGRVRHGDLLGALTVLTRQAATPAELCRGWGRAHLTDTPGDYCNNCWSIAMTEQAAQR